MWKCKSEQEIMAPLLTQFTESVLQYRNVGFKGLGKIIGRNGQHISWGIKERLCFLIHSFNYLLSTYCVPSTVVGTRINEQDSELITFKRLCNYSCRIVSMKTMTGCYEITHQRNI